MATRVRSSPDHLMSGHTGGVSYIVDPKPWLKAELAAKRAELDAAADEADRARLQAEITELEHSLRPRLFRWHRPHIRW
jgi:glutamate synthase domain-containing protein 3